MEKPDFIPLSDKAMKRMEELCANPPPIPEPLRDYLLFGRFTLEDARQRPQKGL